MQHHLNTTPRREKNKTFATTKPTTPQQDISLPSPLGEGLGVRPVAVGARPIVGGVWRMG